MKCIFCLKEETPSEEHVIPESIGGSIVIKDVCKKCNSNVNSRIDNPFSNTPLIKLGRFSYGIGGKRDNIPSPFGIGMDENGLKIAVDKTLTPHVKRKLEITKNEDGSFNVVFAADAADKDKLNEILVEPVRKFLAKEYPDWSDEKIENEVGKVLDAARNAPESKSSGPVKYSWANDFEAISLEYMKIAYEFWFKEFGFDWVENSPIAAFMRSALLTGEHADKVRGQFPCEELQLPFNNPNDNHCILLFGGICYVRLFSLASKIECDVIGGKYCLDPLNAKLIIQNFKTGEAKERKLSDAILEVNM